MTKQLTPLRRKDQAAGYQAAVREIVVWLREQYVGRLQSPVFLADEIEAKFGGSTE